MLETNSTSPTLGDQCRLVGETLRGTIGHPTTLLYPLCKSLLAVGLVCLLLVGLFVPVRGVGPDVPVGLLTMLVAASLSIGLIYVIGPVLALGLDVAYCYELRELRRGSRPVPGAGLVFAARRLPRITLGAVAASGTFLAGYVTDSHSLRVGSGVLGTLLAPALVSEDGSVRDLVAHIETVAAEQWGTTALAVYGVGTVAKGLGALSIAFGVGIVAGHWLGVLPVVTTIWQALGLAVVVLFGGLALATFCQSLVDGPVALALYEQANRNTEATDESVVLETVWETL